MSLYNLRRLAPDTFMIAKFSEDFEVESTYTLVRKGFSYTCDCPANARSVVTKPCRHKLMMPTLLPKVDTDQFYDFDTGKFSTPLGDLADLRSEIDLSQPENVGEALGSSSPEAVPVPAPATASYNGKTPAFDAGNLGSNPSAVASPAQPTIIRRR